MKMKKVIPVLVAIVLIIAIVGIAFGKEIIDKYSYSDEVYDMTVYFENKSDSDVAVIMKDTFMEERAYLFDGVYYVDMEFTDTYLNDRFFYDDREDLLIYTLPTDIQLTTIGTSVVENSEGPTDFGYKVTRREGEKILVALDYVKKFTNFEYHAYSEPERIQMYTSWEEIQTATVKKATQVRHRGGIKEEILKELKPGDKLTVIEQMEEWSKVKTEDAIIGFVENKKLNGVIAELPIPVTDYAEPEYTNLCRNHKINMGWHAIASASGNDTLESVVSGTKGLNVISPTWFTLTDSEGNYDSYATEAYVKKAHDMGLEVWPTFNNIDHQSEVNMTEVLAGRTRRKALIDRLTNDILTLGADGINIDIEMLPVEAGRYYSEFIRELSIECRRNNIVLSVDNYVPIGNTDYYDRATQGEVVDYVVIMGYDEHYAGSNEPGSVASIGYVETGLANTISAGVPSSKIINGIPFYTRIWDIAGADVTSRAMDMPSANEWVANHNVQLQWDETTCQNYGECTYDNADHKVWMEDAESVKVKLNVMETYEIGGVAEWRLGYETSDIWDVIEEYLNK